MHRVVGALLLLAGAAFPQQVRPNFAEQAPPEVRKIIDESLSGSGMHLFVNFESVKSHFNVDPALRLSDFRAGDPVREYSISLDSLANADTGTAVSNLLTPLDMWMVPICAHGSRCLLYEIAKSPSDGKWKAFSLGFSDAPGQVLNRITNTWPASRGYHPLYVTCPEAHRTFFHVPEKGDWNLTSVRAHPSDPLRMIPDTTYTKLQDSRDVLGYLKSCAQARGKGRAK